MRAGALDWCLGVGCLNVYKLNKIEKDEYNELKSSAKSVYTINTSLIGVIHVIRSNCLVIAYLFTF